MARGSHRHHQRVTVDPDFERLFDDDQILFEAVAAPTDGYCADARHNGGCGHRDDSTGFSLDRSHPFLTPAILRPPAMAICRRTFLKASLAGGVGASALGFDLRPKAPHKSYAECHPARVLLIQALG